MSAMKIKKGDTVKVIAGKDNGKEGKVLAVNAKDNTVIVENINKVTKHSKPSAANQQGGIITKEAPLHISNVMLVVDGQATMVLSILLLTTLPTRVFLRFLSTIVSSYYLEALACSVITVWILAMFLRTSLMRLVFSN